MKKIFISLVFSLLLMSAWSQLPAYQNSFDSMPFQYSKTKGIHGNAVNLTGTAAYRVPIVEKNTLENYMGNFSVSIWVKAAPTARQAYVIFASNHRDNAIRNTPGWQIGMQADGAWYCTIQDAGSQYDYSPTPAKQSINDGKWHQLAFSYDTAKKEAAFYFDGCNKAIMHTPEIKSLMNDQLITGGVQEGAVGEWEAFNGCIDEARIFTSLLPADYLLKDYYHSLSLPVKINKPVTSSFFTVMNYNIFHGGHETGKEVGLQRIIEVIRASGADIISMEETYGSGPAIADALGYYFYLRSTNLGIFSRYPIESTLPGGIPFNNGGALIQMPNGEKIAFYTNWITYPVDYWDKFEKGQSIDSAYWYGQQDKVNAQTMRNTLESIAASVANAENIPVVFCGDLNTGSHLDWIESTRHLNNGYVMPFPTTKLMEQRGFIDTYRKLHPDPLNDRGITWSPLVPTDFKDRIDYIFYKSGRLKPVESRVIETHPVRYPSDHGAIITRFEWVK